MSFHRHVGLPNMSRIQAEGLYIHLPVISVVSVYIFCISVTYYILQYAILTNMLIHTMHVCCTYVFLISPLPLYLPRPSRPP
jgi:hypothetical protein